MSTIKSARIAVVGFVVLLIITSCARNSDMYSIIHDSEDTPASSHLAPSTDEPVILADSKDGTNSNNPSTKPARQIIFTADIYLLVDSISETLEKIVENTEKLQGYMQSMDSRTIVVRIPAKKFKSFLTQVGGLGKITDKNIVGHDVTAKMMDLNIRLENAENLRKRYAKLLERGDKVEDMLKIEKAMGEITEKIELMKGQIRFMKNKIAFSTVTVHLNSALPQKDIQIAIPIAWVRNIGSSIANTRKYTQSSYKRGNIVDCEFPDSFMKLSGGYRTTAMSPEGVYLEITEKSNSEGGSLDFWTKLISSSLEKKSALIIKSNKELKLDTGWSYRLITAEKTIRNKKYIYYLALTVFKDSVYLYEVWGPEKEFNKNKDNIIKSIQSMEIGTFMDIFFSPSLW